MKPLGVHRLTLEASIMKRQWSKEEITARLKAIKDC